MLVTRCYLILDDEKKPRSETLYDKHWKEKVNPSDLSHSSTLEDLGQHLPRADEPELEHWNIITV